ncbi:MAG TPA: DoxX family protein [Mucilaginibacter sp.]|nr:DoxX family protein [Mucilaginibacter sp.]
MKATKIIYWTTTSIVGLMMFYSAYAYITQPAIAQGFVHLGFPSYFRIELAAAKFIGAGLLLAPVNLRIKEWVYSGFVIVFISAFIAHTASGDPVTNRAMPVIFLLLTLVSYFTLHRIQEPAPAKS